MPASAIKRWVVLGGVLLATVIAAVWPRAEEHATSQVVAPVVRDERAGEKPTPLPRSELPKLGEQLERTPAAAGTVADLFAATSWQVERRSAPAKPAPPSAPPFPYAIAGILLDGMGLMVVFSKQNQSFVVRAGDMLDENYRVESVDSQSVTVRYLPLKMTSVLPLRGSR